MQQSTSHPERHHQRARKEQIEAEVLHLMGEIGAATAGRLHDILTAGIEVSYPTVLRAVRELAARGHLQAYSQGRVTVYQLTSSSEQSIDAPIAPDADAEIASGYRMVAGTGSWRGEVGAGLIIGGDECRPALPTAQLVLAAVYDADGEPVYRLSASEGSLRWEGQPNRSLARIIIPAAAGASLGPPALVAGRLFPPTSAEHRFSAAKRGQAARMARLNPARLGSLVARYLQHHGLSYAALAAKLATSTTALDNIMLCWRPATCEEEGEAWRRYVRFVADIDGVPVSLLSAVLRDATRLEREARVMSDG